MADPDRWIPGDNVPFAPLPSPAPAGWFQQQRQYYEDQFRNSLSRLGNVGLAGLLPPAIRDSWGSAAHVLAELSPGAGVRDFLQSSGDLTRSVLDANPAGAAGALAGMTLGILGSVPGGRFAKPATEVAPYLREGMEALTAHNPRGLAIDEASRGLRARDMSFDPGRVFYHATDNQHPIRSFNPDLSPERATFLADSPAVADSYLRSRMVVRDPRSPETMLSLDVGNGWGRIFRDNAQIYPVVLRDYGKFRTMDMAGAGYADSVDVIQNALREARRAGVPGIVFNNMRDPGPYARAVRIGDPKAPSTIAAVLDPKYIRSRFATFDPTKIDSRDLLAGLMPIMTPAGLLWLAPSEGDGKWASGPAE